MFHWKGLNLWILPATGLHVNLHQQYYKSYRYQCHIDMTFGLKIYCILLSPFPYTHRVYNTRQRTSISHERYDISKRLNWLPYGAFYSYYLPPRMLTLEFCRYSPVLHQPDSLLSLFSLLHYLLLSVFW